jgi:hypothetical protein
MLLGRFQMFRKQGALSWDADNSVPVSRGLILAYLAMAACCSSESGLRPRDAHGLHPRNDALS